ncbi:putative D-alanyl-D-alanine carboxypeptidase/D-alanyl-D-alanine-endopeptidase [Corallococcus coralloides]|uniref:Putative D-alanyl-D-alanine carboxypeptidase/D-alanyl-D-alanine-endopeptidase n=1 Tax=Corallococcus coralloides TaxID=184914 RepID=A0A410RWI2_CORCK|nr:D-alanyl-D-alanine carboxypeptidase/D-alanyl-D-alanine-endopeptidase [Corallococcus coralloides]QAT86233.1 putative D-alanyl-D-alanine carboxypeptidase/D-alanyl-D-alanine-endopeptidase [Corallococcus coralloides]
MRRALLPASVVALFLSACTHTAATPDGAPRDTLPGVTKALLETLEADGALAGAYVVDARTGEPLFTHRENVRLLPASTMKVVSTSAVLSALGADFRFTTPVFLEGSQAGGLFLGDVVAQASGDPSLGSWRFPETALACDRIAEAFQARGIHQWRGNVRISGTDGLDGGMGPGWAWDDAAYAYSAAPTPFVFRENVVDLALARAPGATCADAPSVQWTPTFATLSAVVNVDVNAERANLACVRGGGGVRCTWRSPTGGPCPQAAAVKLSVDAPEALFAACVDDALARHGVTRLPLSLEAPTPPLPPLPSPLVELTSPPLSELVRVTNKESLNLYAERLGMRFARERTGQEGYTALRTALVAELARRGVPTKDLRPVDGSGLSRYNLASPRGMARVLLTSLQEPYGAALVDSLPVLGVDGTLAGRKTKPSTAGRIRAKTGTLTGQKCFVGVAERPNDTEHPRVVFALMLGNMDEGTKPNANETFDTFSTALVELPLR